jgi:hypothetical protein
MSVVSSGDYRGLAWAHGALAAQRLGGMMAPVTFMLADGRQVSPLHIAPWAHEPTAPDLPGILRRLRGDWPCAPFGYSVDAKGWPADWAATMGPAEPDEEVHGHCSNHDWRWREAPGGSLRLSIDYPAASPIERVERSVTPDPNSAAVDLEFSIIVRRRCRMPVGLHPVFRLPKQAGAARLELGRFDCGRTYPGTVEPKAPMFAMNQIFHDLAAVPGRDGKTIDASRLPFAADTEELLQIEGLDGAVALANDAEGYRVRLIWQTEHFPSLLLWISNRGRKFEPWNGRHLALGIEPVCSPFGLGSATAVADNPIAISGVPTARDFSPDTTFVTRYRIEAELL